MVNHAKPKPRPRQPMVPMRPIGQQPMGQQPMGQPMGQQPMGQQPMGQQPSKPNRFSRMASTIKRKAS